MLLATALVVSSCNRTPASMGAGTEPRAERVREALLADLGSLDSALALLDARALSARVSDSTIVRAAFDDARYSYKRIEFAVEGLMPTVAKGLNGPPITEMEDEESDRPIRPPEGLQVIEQLIGSVAEPDSAAESMRRIAMEARIARSYVARARQVAAASRYTDAAIIDLLRREIASVAILGLGHYDAVDQRRGMRECAVALQGVRRALEAYRVDAERAAPNSWRVLDASMMRAVARLNDIARRRDVGSMVVSSDDRTPERLALLVSELRPAAIALMEIRSALRIGIPINDDGWRAAAATPFEIDAIDPASYAHASALASTPERVALGRDLFFDKRLSRDQSRSCDACHVPERAFTDGRATALMRAGGRSAGLGPEAMPARNTPTLINSGVQPVQFSDGRVAFMEDQIASVVHNRREMDGDLSLAASRLNASAGDRDRFVSAFGASGDSTVTSRRVQSAITAYLRSLTRLGAPFDRFVRGDRAAMSADAQRGFEIFMGKGRCGTCHFAPTFGAAIPTRYQHVDYEVLGVPDANRRRLDRDVGRERVAGDSLQRYAFRTPALRNVALTAPYMHNGAFRSLAEVITFYNNGGGRGMGFDVPNQTLPADSLHLTAAEQRALIAFLGALTDTTGTTRRPTRASAVALRASAQRGDARSESGVSGALTPGTAGTRNR